MYSLLCVYYATQVLYVGGHENHNFSLLPHDIPVHRGFDGCIFDLTVKTRPSISSASSMIVPLSTMVGNEAADGRNVYQCHADICASEPCHNGGTCIGYGSSFMYVV